MDCHGKRGRRRGNHHRQPPTVPCGSHDFTPCRSKKPWSFLNGFCSLLIMSSLMAIIYLILEYHCTTCSAKCDMNNIAKNIDDIAKNLTHIKLSYNEFEKQISRFSYELPKLEGQIEILEALAITLEGKSFGWNPKTHLTPPNVDVYLSKTQDGRNISQLSSKHTREILAV